MKISLPPPKMKVPCFDLPRQNEPLREELEASFRKILQSAHYILGPSVEAFEKKFAAYCGSAHGIGVGSGTDALIFSLKALGIGPEDEVITPSYTFVATVFAILHVGAVPVLADIDPETYTLDPASVQKQLSRRTRALLPVHLYGQPAKMDELLEIAHKKKLKIIEDACQAHGATWKNKKVGSLGDAGCFSFYPTKTLGGLGDGGMVVTGQAGLAEKIIRLRNLGRKGMSEDPADLGWTSRLHGLQAAALEVKLRHLEEGIARRRKIAERYKNLLSSTPLILPAEARDARHTYYLFAVRVPDGKRDSLQKKLSDEGVQTVVHYRTPIHRQPFYRNYVKRPLRLGVSEKIASEVLCLPLFPGLRDEEIDYVCQILRQFYHLNP